jgi:hypothetical protein
MKKKSRANDTSGKLPTMNQRTDVLIPTCGRVTLIGDLTNPLSSSTYHHCIFLKKKINTRESIFEN